jgi:hypothetical protein
MLSKQRAQMSKNKRNPESGNPNIHCNSTPRKKQPAHELFTSIVTDQLHEGSPYMQSGISAAPNAMDSIQHRYIVNLPAERSHH